MGVTGGVSLQVSVRMELRHISAFLFDGHYLWGVGAAGSCVGQAWGVRVCGAEVCVRKMEKSWPGHCGEWGES